MKTLTELCRQANRFIKLPEAESLVEYAAECLEKCIGEVGYERCCVPQELEITPAPDGRLRFPRYVMGLGDVGDAPWGVAPGLCYLSGRVDFRRQGENYRVAAGTGPVWCLVWCLDTEDGDALCPDVLAPAVVARIKCQLIEDRHPSLPADSARMLAVFDRDWRAGVDYARGKLSSPTAADWRRWLEGIHGRTKRRLAGAWR